MKPVRDSRITGGDISNLVLSGVERLGYVFIHCHRDRVDISLEDGRPFRYETDRRQNVIVGLNDRRQNVIVGLNDVLVDAGFYLAHCNATIGFDSADYLMGDLYREI